MVISCLSLHLARNLRAKVLKFSDICKIFGVESLYCRENSTKKVSFRRLVCNTHLLLVPFHAPKGTSHLSRTLWGNLPANGWRIWNKCVPNLFFFLVNYLPMAAIAAANIFDVWQFSKTATDGLNTHMQ